MMLFNFIVVFYIVCADVMRDDGYTNYERQFTVVKRGRMLRVLMFFKNVHLEICALHCVRHLRCKTINYNYAKKDCELTDENFDEMNVDEITPGWYNYETPPKVDGGWSSWQNYTDCTKRCGNGTLEQWRECDSPTPQYGGAYCKGRERRTVTCTSYECKAVIFALEGKAVKQSLTYDDRHKYIPSNAIDGRDSTYSCTEKQYNPWWEIDLAEIIEIKDVYLHVSFTDSNYNHHLFVETRKRIVDSWIICKDVGEVKEKMQFNCNERPTNARFLKIRSTGYCFLAIYDIKIYVSQND